MKSKFATYFLILNLMLVYIKFDQNVSPFMKFTPRNSGNIELIDFYIVSGFNNLCLSKIVDQQLIKSICD